MTINFNFKAMKIKTRPLNLAQPSIEARQSFTSITDLGTVRLC